MIMHKVPLTLLSAVIFLLAFEARSQSNRWLSYDPAVVELEGRLTVQRRYGPPNFGEQPKTDAKVKVPIIVLKNPVNVRGTPGAAPNDVDVKRIKRIQLIFEPGQMNYAALVGKKIVVKGKLFHAHTGHHYTDVVMSVVSIEPANRN